MNYSKILTSLVIVGTMVFMTSCSTESSVETDISPQAQMITKPTTWEVSTDDLEDELLAAVSMEDYLTKEDIENSILTISMQGNGKYLFSLIVLNDPSDDPAPGVIVCAGSGISFVNCCSDYLEDHPCLTVSGDGNGGYTADNDC
jgi:hypothetical protein